MFSQISTSLRRTGLSGAQAGPAVNSLLSGKSEGAAAKIHRTAPDSPVSQTAPTANGRLRDQWATRGRANVGWSHRTVRCAPDCVKCANGTRDPTVGFARKGRRSCTRQELFMSGGAPDCPVHHSTEGKNCLPIGSPTAPSCLGAIKGTPRRME
jgi:hypothetical protein